MMATIISMADIRTGRQLAASSHDLRRIGRRLEAARKAAGFGLTELATRVGLAHNTLSQWENGTRRPSIEQLVLLLPALRLTLDFVYLGDDRALDWETREAISRHLSEPAADVPEAPPKAAAGF